MKRHGYSLAAVTALCALALFMMLLALDVMIKTYRRGAQAESYQIALRYAENGFKLAQVRLRDDPKWGQKAGDLLQVPPLPDDRADTGASVRFTSTPSDPDPTLSLNRVGLEGSATTASGLLVPANSVHLVSTGTHRGVHATVDGIVAVSPFPFALASSGQLATDGAFLVGSLEDPAALDDPIALQKSLKRGSLLSNAPGTSVSLSGSPVRVTGDIVCVGSASLGAGVVVEGEVKENRDPKPMPTFTLSDYDTAVKEGVRILETQHLTQPEAFEGYVRASGDIVVDGELRLSEAIVYVDGSLTVRGPLSGRGALFVTGPVRLESSSIGALDALAIVSGGPLSITGRGKAASRIVGLLVSQGDLSLSDVTVVGATVCTGDASRVLRLHNVDVFGSSKGTEFAFDLGWGMKTDFQVPVDPFRDTPGGLVRLAQVMDASTGVKHTAAPADFVGRYDPAKPDAPLLRESDFEVVVADGSVKTMAQAHIPFDHLELQSQLLSNLQAAAISGAKADPQNFASHGKLSLDLNKFLRLGDTLQVVYRRLY